MIGQIRKCCQCGNNGKLDTVELEYSRKLSKIMLQKHATKDSIKAISLMDDAGIVTVIGQPDIDSTVYFDKKNWKFFNIKPEESLLEVTNSDNFDKIEFVVGKIPLPKSCDE